MKSPSGAFFCFNSIIEMPFSPLGGPTLVVYVLVVLSPVPVTDASVMKRVLFCSATMLVRSVSFVLPLLTNQALFSPVVSRYSSSNLTSVISLCSNWSSKTRSSMYCWNFLPLI